MADNKALRASLWLLGGVAVGAVAGVLLAPKAGEETRRDLASWLRKKREQLPVKKDAVVAAFRAGKEAYQETGGHKKETVAA